MAWIYALNPSEQTFEELKPYIQESYEYNICQLIGNQIVIHIDYDLKLRTLISAYAP